MKIYALDLGVILWTLLWMAIVIIAGVWIYKFVRKRKRANPR